MSHTLELTPRQRERLDAIKDELEEAEPECPRPTDEQVFNSLLDTWDAVGEFHSDDSTQTQASKLAEYYQQEYREDGHAE